MRYVFDFLLLFCKLCAILHDVNIIWSYSQEDHRFKLAKKVRNPKHRLRRVLDCCKSKQKCEGGDDIEEEQGNDEEIEKKKKHGGCGYQQPKIYIDGMKIMAEFKPSKKKADEQEQYLPEPVERKQQLTAEKVSTASHEHFFMLNTFY
jgi:DNA-directed RNA polymerase II subunit RPB1